MCMRERLFLFVVLYYKFLCTLIQQIYTKHSLDARVHEQTACYSCVKSWFPKDQSPALLVLGGTTDTGSADSHVLVMTEALLEMVLGGAPLAEAFLAESLRTAAQAKASF